MVQELQPGELKPRVYIHVYKRPKQEFSCGTEREGSGTVTAAAWVAAVEWVQSLAPGNFDMLWVQPNKKKKDLNKCMAKHQLINTIKENGWCTQDFLAKSK